MEISQVLAVGRRGQSQTLPALVVVELAEVRLVRPQQEHRDLDGHLGLQQHAERQSFGVDRQLQVLHREQEHDLPEGVLERLQGVVVVGDGLEDFGGEFLALQVEVEVEPQQFQSAVGVDEPVRPLLELQERGGAQSQLRLALLALYPAEDVLVDDEAAVELVVVAGEFEDLDVVGGLEVEEGLRDLSVVFQFQRDRPQFAEFLLLLDDALLLLAYPCRQLRYPAFGLGCLLLQLCLQQSELLQAGLPLLCAEEQFLEVLLGLRLLLVAHALPAHARPPPLLALPPLVAQLDEGFVVGLHQRHQIRVGHCEPEVLPPPLPPLPVAILLRRLFPQVQVWVVHVGVAGLRLESHLFDPLVGTQSDSFLLFSGRGSCGLGLRWLLVDDEFDCFLEWFHFLLSGRLPVFSRLWIWRHCGRFLRWLGSLRGGVGNVAIDFSQKLFVLFALVLPIFVVDHNHFLLFVGDGLLAPLGFAFGGGTDEEVFEAAVARLVRGVQEHFVFVRERCHFSLHTLVLQYDQFG